MIYSESAVAAQAVSLMWATGTLKDMDIHMHRHTRSTSNKKTSAQIQTQGLEGSGLHKQKHMRERYLVTSIEVDTQAHIFTQMLRGTRKQKCACTVTHTHSLNAARQQTARCFSEPFVCVCACVCLSDTYLQEVVSYI